MGGDPTTRGVTGTAIAGLTTWDTRRGDAGARKSGGDRRRRHRLLGPLPPRKARLDGFRPRRAVPAHARLDLAFGGPRRPAALVALADEADAVLGRAVCRAEGADGQRSGLAPARRPAARVVGGAPGGDPPAGFVGEDVRAADGDRLAAGGAGALSADEHGRRRRCGV